jgi:hypothetical protein
LAKVSILAKVDNIFEKRLRLLFFTHLFSSAEKDGLSRVQGGADISGKNKVFSFEHEVLFFELAFPLTMTVECFPVICQLLSAFP